MIKTIVAALFVSMLAGCIIPIPIGAIDSAIEGSHCVSANAKVGDIVTDARSGNQYRITEINGNSDGSASLGCGARLPFRAKADLVQAYSTTTPPPQPPPSPYQKYLNVDINEDLNSLGKPKEIRPGDHGYDYYVWSIDGCDTTFIVSQTTHKVDGITDKNCSNQPPQSQQ